MSKANDFLAEQVLPRVITAFEMTRDAIKAVIEFIARLITRLNEFRQRALDTIGRIVPGFNRLRNAVGENIEKFVEWGNAQVASRREALQNTLAIREQNQAVEAANNAYKKYIDSIIGLTSNLNTLTQEEVNSIKASLQVEVQRLTAEEQATAIGERRLQLTRDRQAAEEALTKVTSIQVIELGELAEAQRMAATVINEVASATAHLIGLDEKHLDELQDLLIEKRKSIQADFDKAESAEAAAAANAILLQSEKALLDIQEERARRFAETDEGRAAAAVAAQAAAFKSAMDELAEQISSTAQDTIGFAIFDAFSNIFSMDLSQNIREFGANILRGMGSIFAQMGQAMIAASPLFKAIGAAMTNPFTAGPASLKFGLALVALGGTLGAIATKVGGTGGMGMMERPSGRLQVSGLSGREFGGEAKLIIQGGLLDMSDPRQASALGRAIGELSGRRVILQGA
jgi:hypothetical protein